MRDLFENENPVGRLILGTQASVFLGFALLVVNAVSIESSPFRHLFASVDFYSALQARWEKSIVDVFETTESKFASIIKYLSSELTLVHFT